MVDINRNNTRKLLANKYLSAFFFIVALSRGGLEILTSKNISYLIQGVTSIAFFSYLVFYYSKIASSLLEKVTKLIFCILFSMVISFPFVHELAILSFSVVMFFTCFVFLSSLSSSRIIPIQSIYFLGFLVCFTVLWAWGQQIGIVQISEDSTFIAGFIRPSSITGSYLHYPLILVLTFFIFLQFCTYKKIFILFAVITLAGLISSFSRSGILILVVGLFFYVAKNKKIIHNTISFGFVLAIIAACVYLFDLEFFDNLYQRYLTASSLESEGNSERFESWTFAIKDFADGFILFGNKFGLYGNVSGNLLGSHYGVVESGVLELMLSLGLIGTYYYFRLMYYAYTKISKNHLWLKSAYFGSALQVLFYQSIEVLPFIVLMALVPLLSKTLIFYISFQRSGADA